MGKHSRSIAREARKIKIRELRQDKQTPLCEVARLVGLSSATSIYAILQEMAEEDGRPYREYLDYPHAGYHREAPIVTKPKADAESPSVESVSESPFDELLADLQRMHADCENMLTVLNNTIHAMKGE